MLGSLNEFQTVFQQQHIQVTLLDTISSFVYVPE